MIYILPKSSNPKEAGYVRFLNYLSYFESLNIPAEMRLLDGIWERNKITLLKRYLYLRVGIWRRIFNLYRFDFQKNCKIISYESNWLFLLLLMFKSRRLNAEVYVELNEMQKYKGTDYPSFLARLRHFLSFKIAFEFISGFIVISESLKQFLIASNFTGKIVLVPSITSDFLPDNDLRISVSSPYVFLPGPINVTKDDSLFILKALGLLNRKYAKEPFQIYYNSYVPKELKYEFNQILKKYCLYDEVHFITDLNYRKYIELVRGSEFVFLIKAENKQNLYNLPNRLGEFISLRKTIVSNCYGELSRYLNQKNSITCVLEDYEGLAQRLSELDEIGILEIGETLYKECNQFLNPDALLEI